MTTPTTPLSVVVVDDSAVQRRFLRGAIDAAPEFDVVGEARNGKEAVALVERLRPHAIVMDLDLPVMGGVEAIERIMATCATPILVYSAFVAGEGSANALEALSAGAVDVLAKPGPQDTKPLDEYAETLRTRLKMVSRIRVITHPRGRLRTSGQLTGEAATLTGVGRRPLAAAPVIEAMPMRDGVKLLVIGASTGGPHALLSVLSALPADLPQAVLVVQHMAEGFIAGLASWLDQLVPLPVSVGESGRRLVPGTVTLAPSGGNLLVQDDRLRVLVTPPEPGQFHVPGIDATMRSVAEALGSQAVGVLLTGMGRDGAAGLLAMRRRGALTIGQDEATCAVYGMPAAAAALDAIDRQLPIDAIGPALCEVLVVKSKTAG
jgi:two-component system chemotaxis response regulator CheB